MKRTRLQSVLPAAIAALCTAGSTAAFAAPPRLSLVPPKNTGFLVDQRFDIRGEATLDAGRTVSTISIAVDGVTISTQAATTPSFYDAATRSLTVRQFSLLTTGTHTITLRVTDSANESSTLTKSYNVINPFGNRKPVKNIIFFLGDGMGAAHKTAARLARFGLDEGRTNGFLAMDGMPNIASILTHSLNSLITDSAPGMANYVTGSKANNNQEGVYPDNTSNTFFDVPASGMTPAAPNHTGAFDNPRIEYLSEYLSRKFGKSTGIVSTADIEDATPAANAIHTQDRNAGTGICDQYFDERNTKNLRVLMGGGRRWFLPNTVIGSNRSNATDYALPAATASALGVTPGALDPGRNLISDFQGDGFSYAPTRAAMNAIPASADKVLGLFQYGNMNVALDKINGRRGINPPTRTTSVVADAQGADQPMLDEMAAVAIRTLNNNNPKGFFLMVEAAHIDKQSHLMDADRAIYETLEFDNAVRKGIEFANQDGNTLVIVSADHECAGFVINGSVSSTTARGLASDAGKFDPTVQPVRQTAIGGAFPNYGAMLSPDGLTPDPLTGYPATPDGAVKLVIGFGASGDRYEDFLAKPFPVNDGIQTLAIALGTLTAFPASVQTRTPEATSGMFLRGQQSGGNGSQAGHTANEIPLYAYSTGSRASTLFFGLLDNTDVFFLMAKAALGGY